MGKGSSTTQEAVLKPEAIQLLQKELGTLTDAVNALKKRHTLYRHYFPAEIRGAMEAVARGTFGRKP